jgi:Flp pilus assembly protein TadD
VPTIPECLELAEQALRAGDLSRAQFIYERVLEAVPSEAHSLNGMGVIAYRAGRLQEAEDYHRRAIAALSADPAFHNNLGQVYARQGRADEAIACARAAVELSPSSAVLHNNLGNVLKQDGRLDEALDSYRHALRLQPTYEIAHYNMANALVELRRLDEAEHAFRRAIELVPDDVEAHTNLGSMLQIQGRFAEAMEEFNTAIDYRADSPEVRRNRAMLRLLQGDFAGGWQDYELRWSMPGAQPPTFAEPCWAGQPLAGRSILLWGEQGLGDIVQMVRYAPLLKDRGATVLVECRDVLHELLKSTPGIDRFVDTVARPEPFDYYIPLMSLPAAFGTTVDTIPARVPYVFADPERVEHWRRQMAGMSALKVGIAWQGNPQFAGDYYRSIPLAEFVPLVSCTNVKLFSLQKGFGREQLHDLAGKVDAVDLGPTLDEGTGAFVETAAVMKNLDLVITSDTAIAHVAGALGVPVWVVLPYVPNWRWLLDRDDCPWYPTMRLFRQPKFRDWTGAMTRVAEALAALSQQRTTG